MCGVAGLMSKGQIERSDIMRMTASLSHRGPDASGVYLNTRSTVAFGHTRLSVIDLSTSANQPMTSSDGRYVLVFNGEIYNYSFLQKQIRSQNPEMRFLTNSDTEVILQGYILWGSDVCSKLEGMFAFAIYDSFRDEVFICRDAVGKKPLYYFRNDILFAFASEIKSLLRHPEITGDKVNYNAVYTFLHIGYVAEPLTAYASIRKFPSGHFAYVRQGQPICFTSFHNTVQGLAEHNTEKIENPIAQLRSVLLEAVRKRLISDVPLGAFLSGGTDSSLVVAMASALKPEVPLKTFTIGFKGSQFDELAYARDVARILKTDHCEYVLAEDEAIGLLEKYLIHFDEPFADTSSIPMMLVSGLAKKHVTVALTGDGGDELFLGYGAYDWADRLDRSWISLFQSPLSYTFKRLGNSRLKRIGFLFEKVPTVEIRSHIFSQEQYFFTRSEVTSMALSGKPSFESLKYQDPDLANLKPAEKQAIYDIQLYLKDDLLVKVDRASMLYGLECRCPFLDQAVVKLALALPYSVKRRGNERKWILKELLKEYLPEELVYRRKWGFGIPLVRWLKNDLAYLIQKYLSKEMVEDIGIVRYSQVETLKRSFFKGDDFLYNRLWVLIVAHKWLCENANGVR